MLQCKSFLGTPVASDHKDLFLSLSPDHCGAVKAPPHTARNVIEVLPSSLLPHLEHTPSCHCSREESLDTHTRASRGLSLEVIGTSVTYTSLARKSHASI